MAEPICIKCKHEVREHKLNDEGSAIECMRVMAIEAGKFYYCRCHCIKETENDHSSPR